MWAQTWGALQNFTQLFPNKPSLDVTNAMVKQKYDANKMFRTSDQFFKDLGLIEMPDLFWNKSMIVKPEGRNVTCHASAWDFYNQKDFRWVEVVLFLFPMGWGCTASISESSSARMWRWMILLLFISELV